MLCACAFTVVRADVIPVSETQKIEFLIDAIAQLSSAGFVRNGVVYNAQEAADHLRLKLRISGTRVKSAEEFIRLCATGSSLTGKPYQIRFADGRVVSSADFLRSKLNELAKRGQ